MEPRLEPLDDDLQSDEYSDEYPDEPHPSTVEIDVLRGEKEWLSNWIDKQLC